MEVQTNAPKVFKCRVPLCKENHPSHFCRECKQYNVSHFSSQCPRKTTVEEGEGEEEEVKKDKVGNNGHQVSKNDDTSKKQKVKKRKSSDVDEAKEKCSTSKKKSIEHKEDKTERKKEKIEQKKEKTEQKKEKTEQKTPPKTKPGKEINAVGTGSLSLMLAKNYEADFSKVKGWLMSEKLDGVRCYWNGSEMYTRTGKDIIPPDWLLGLLPSNLALDGELWTKRDDFQTGVSIVRCQDPSARDWTKITYMVYDAPLLTVTFAERLKIIGQVLHDERSEKAQTHVKLHKHKVCKTEEQLLAKAEKVFSLNGEGLMLKDPQCAYEKKRSAKLLKVKKFDDSEAVVLAHVQGTGRCSNMLGALQVKSKEGKIFKVGSGFDDSQRKNPPKVGSTITFKYQGVSKAGIPRFPIFLREHPGM